MSKRVATLQDWASINDAVRVLHRRRIGSVIVTTGMDSTKGFSLNVTSSARSWWRTSFWTRG